MVKPTPDEIRAAVREAQDHYCDCENKHTSRLADACESLLAENERLEARIKGRGELFETIVRERLGPLLEGAPWMDRGIHVPTVHTAARRLLDVPDDAASPLEETE